MSDRKPSARARRVWQRFGEWYGTRFSESYGPIPSASWCEVIDRESDDALQTALSCIRREYLHHPPSLPEFEAALEKARAPVVKQAVDARAQLEAFVKTKPLSQRQRLGNWTWITRQFDAPGTDGKMRSRHGCEFCGVIVEADGDHPGYRVTVEDLHLESAP